MSGRQVRRSRPSLLRVHFSFKGRSHCFLGHVLHPSLVLFALLPVGHFKKIIFQAHCWWEMQQQLEMP